MNRKIVDQIGEEPLKNQIQLEGQMQLALRTFWMTHKFTPGIHGPTEVEWKKIKGAETVIDKMIVVMMCQVFRSMISIRLTCELGYDYINQDARAIISGSDDDDECTIDVGPYTVCDGGKWVNIWFEFASAKEAGVLVSIYSDESPALSMKNLFGWNDFSMIAKMARVYAREINAPEAPASDIERVKKYSLGLQSNADMHELAQKLLLNSKLRCYSDAMRVAMRTLKMGEILCKIHGSASANDATATTTQDTQDTEDFQILDVD